MRLDLAQLWLPSNQAICWKEDEGTLAPGYHLRHWVSLKDVRKLCALGKAFLIFWEKNFRKFLIKMHVIHAICFDGLSPFKSDSVLKFSSVSPLVWSLPLPFPRTPRIWAMPFSCAPLILCISLPLHLLQCPRVNNLFTYPLVYLSAQLDCNRHCLLFLFVSPTHDHGSCIL